MKLSGLGKSEWVLQSIQSLFNDNAIVDLVLDAEVMTRFDEKDNVLVPVGLHQEMIRMLDAITILVLQARFHPRGRVTKSQVPQIIHHSITDDQDYRTERIPTVSGFIRSAIIKGLYSDVSFDNSHFSLC